MFVWRKINCFEFVLHLTPRKKRLQNTEGCAWDAVCEVRHDRYMSGNHWCIPSDWTHRNVIRNKPVYLKFPEVRLKHKQLSCASYSLSILLSFYHCPLGFFSLLQSLVILYCCWCWRCYSFPSSPSSSGFFFVLFSSFLSFVYSSLITFLTAIDSSFFLSSFLSRYLQYFFFISILFSLFLFKLNILLIIKS